MCLYHYVMQNETLYKKFTYQVAAEGCYLQAILSPTSNFPTLQFFPLDTFQLTLIPSSEHPKKHGNGQT